VPHFSLPAAGVGKLLSWLPALTILPYFLFLKEIVECGRSFAAAGPNSDSHVAPAFPTAR
jgi:hypothetical protein